MPGSTTQRPIDAKQTDAPIPVVWYIGSYYPTAADGQVASVISTLFQSRLAAETWGRAQLVSNSNVGMVFVQEVPGLVITPLVQTDVS